MYDGAANWNQANESVSCWKHSILAENTVQVMFDGTANWNWGSESSPCRKHSTDHVGWSIYWTIKESLQLLAENAFRSCWTFRFDCNQESVIFLPKTQYTSCWTFIWLEPGKMVSRFFLKNPQYRSCWTFIWLERAGKRVCGLLLKAQYTSCFTVHLTGTREDGLPVFANSTVYNIMFGSSSH